MTNVIAFPSKMICLEEQQLNLFDYSDRNVGKYNFLDLYDTNQTEMIEALEEFDFRAILDIRNFPTFERPLYNHRKFLVELKSMEILYLPIVYMKNINTPYRQFKPYKQRFGTAVDCGPILFLYNKNDTKPSDLERWACSISRRYGNLFEAHPSTFRFS